MTHEARSAWRPSQPRKWEAEAGPLKGELEQVGGRVSWGKEEVCSMKELG